MKELWIAERYIGPVYPLESLLQRTKGYMFDKQMTHALFFQDSGTLIHSCFMSQSFDVLIAREDKVKVVRRNLMPWRFFWLPSGDMYEAPSGWFKQVEIGDCIQRI